MKETLKSLFETGVLHLAVLCLIFALALAVSGCRVIKVNRSADGEYRAYYNSHWFSTKADSVTAGMSPDGSFTLSLAGVESTPSEEFNKMMATTMTTFSQMLQIAAAAYNPSASAALKSAAARSESAPVASATAPAAASVASATAPAAASVARATAPAAAACTGDACAPEER